MSEESCTVEFTFKDVESEVKFCRQSLRQYVKQLKYLNKRKQSIEAQRRQELDAPYYRTICSEISLYNSLVSSTSDHLSYLETGVTLK